ncbi:MAG TPA: glycerol kinase GlpK [Thermodesulfobacteriota bacterium]
MPTLLALDAGTTSTRAVLFGAGGEVLDVAQREFPQRYPRPGWVEHDPEAIWDSQLACAREVVARAAEPPAALGITNQRETVLVWDRRTGAPVAPAIVWQDRRTAAACEAIAADAAFTRLIRERTGLLPDPYFSATKLAWLLDHVPGVRARAEAGELAAGTVDTFLLWRFTGGRVHATDASNASRTLLYDIHRGRWDEELCARFGVPPALLPEVRDSAGDYGTAEASVLGRAVAIRGVAGDQQAATFGQACLAAGMAKNTYGTGCFVVMNTGTVARDSASGLLTTVAWRLGGRTTYALEGAIFVAGAAVQWLRDELGIVRTAAETAALAASLDGNDDVYLVPAFVGLGAPYWDPRARGTIVGLTRGTTRAHLARAALEAVAYQSADVLEAMAADCGEPLRELRIDGGMVTNDWLCQFQADVLEVPVVRPAVVETTALGAAALAGLAAGVFPDPAAFARTWREERRFEPRTSRRAERARWREAVARAREWDRA